MMLPNHEQAYIPEPKLTEYLLSETHAVGRAKTKYFRSLGYTEANAAQLADSLLGIAKSERVSQEVATHYGTEYVVEGDLVAPTEVIVRIRTVWVIESHDKRPRFLTAYPA